MTIKLYTERAQGVMNKEAKKLNKGDKLIVDKVTYVEGRKILHLEVIFKDLTQLEES